MVDVDVNVQDPWVVFEELEDREDDVIHIAKARRLAFFRVVQSTRPVDGNVGRALIQLDRAIDRRARVDLAELKHAVKDWAVRALAHIELGHL